MARPRGINVIKTRLFLDRSALENTLKILLRAPGTSLSRYVSEALRRHNLRQGAHVTCVRTESHPTPSR